MLTKRFINKTFTVLTLFIFFLTTMLFSPVNPAMAGEWSEITTTNQPTNIITVGSAQDNNYFYVIGGQDSSGNNYLKTVYRYDPVNQTYTQLSDMPIGLDRCILAHVIDGYLYVFGGIKSGNTYNRNVYRLSLSENIWEDLGAASQFFAQSGMAVQGNYAYFYGGAGSGESLLRYDFGSNSWTDLGANPRGLTTIWQPSGFATPDGKIHFYAGGTGPTNNDTFFNNVVTYDPANGNFSMSSIPAYGTPKRQARNVQLGSKIYFIGGSIGTAGINEVVSYDVNTGTWDDEPPLPLSGSMNPMTFSENLLAFREGNIYKYTPDGHGGFLLQASITGQSAAYFSPSEFTPAHVTLNGTDGLKAIYTTSPWNVTDARGTGAGWYATMSATVPTSSNGKTIPLANLKLTVSNVNKATDALTSSNPAVLQYANGVTLENPNTVLASPANQGMGTFVFTPGLELSIPASSYAGQYNSTITASFYEIAPVI